MKVWATLKQLNEATRPVHPDARRALDERWNNLPAGVRTPSQIVGRAAIGCEGTRGVFPKCNFACTPCYHSKDANKVRIDGDHTLREINAQMALLRDRRGPRGHAQLIGGEVSLLDPDDHAAALLAMHEHGREPMSMTHGDFGADYLRALVTDPDGKVRLRRVSFAVHFDSLMSGRRGAKHPENEAELNPFRRQFVEMFRDLRRQLGVRFYLAHNMTVTPTNMGQIATVVQEVVRMGGYSLMSFQPAAFVGDERRWKEAYDELSIDRVWDELERGVGSRLIWEPIVFGDTRCNRTAFGFLVANRWVSFLDQNRPADMKARDRYYAHLGGVRFRTAPALLAAMLLRVVLRHPTDVVVAICWAAGLVRRSGGLVRLLSAACRRQVRLMTFVVHKFMDAADVESAWKLSLAGEVASDPQIRATQERLAACAYTMARPETGELVPACLQHAVFDPIETANLRRLLPLTVVRN